jgi:hypothetical protein
MIMPTPRRSQTTTFLSREGMFSDRMAVTMKADGFPRLVTLKSCLMS